MPSQAHWDTVYSSKSIEAVSWFQKESAVSLSLMMRAGCTPSWHVLDVGGGASTLVDQCLDRGVRQMSVLDISAVALDVARGRLGARADSVQWLVGDITQLALPEASYDMWHDRAVFHFLTEPAQQQAYVTQAQRAIKPGGHLLIATFAIDGPVQCSDLPVVRYEPEQLVQTMGPDFALKATERENHVTPMGREQRFVYALFERLG